MQKFNLKKCCITCIYTNTQDILCFTIQANFIWKSIQVETRPGMTKLDGDAKDAN